MAFICSYIKIHEDLATKYLQHFLIAKNSYLLSLQLRHTCNINYISRNNLAITIQTPALILYLNIASLKIIRIVASNKLKIGRYLATT